MVMRVFFVPGLSGDHVYNPEVLFLTEQPAYRKSYGQRIKGGNVLLNRLDAIGRLRRFQGASGNLAEKAERDCLRKAAIPFRV
jgi:hypothetical protein